MHRDYSDRGVKFYYIYKYLAHAGAKGYVNPYTLKERLLHIKEAQRTLGTEIPWLCDSMDNRLKHQLGEAPTSEFVIDPEGRVVRRRAWGNLAELREDLKQLVGPIENPTRPEDLELTTAPPARVAPRGIVKPIKPPGGMKPLRIEPAVSEAGEPFYVKLRPQADRRLLSTGTGRLFLDFRMDPIYHVHWNNLTKPIRVQIDTPAATTAAPNPAIGPDPEEPADMDPRQFLIDVQNWDRRQPLRLKVNYFACNDEQGWCRPVTQHYAVYCAEDVEDGYYVAPLEHGDIWPAFRGPNGNGKSSARNVPRRWGPNQNIAWRSELPGPGDSSPVVASDRVFITCAEDEGKKRSLFCFDRDSGESLWVRTVEFDRVMPTHKTNPYCASTPLVVGSRVIVWHGSAGLYCYDLDGKQLWFRDLGEFRHMWGYASSPIFYRDRIIMNCGPGKNTFVAAIKLTDGEVLWKTEELSLGNGDRNESGKYMGSWSTPVIARIGDQDQLICSHPTRVRGYDIETGEVLWTCDGLRGPKGDLAYSSPIIADDTCVVIGGFNGPSFAFKLGGHDNITEQNRLWREERNPQNIGSGIFVGQHVYVPDAGPGTLRCLNPSTGEVVWQTRLPGGNAWGSIVYANGLAYVTTQSGNTVVFRPSPERYQEVAVNPLNESSNSTPAIAEGEIFIRTFEALYCIRADSQAEPDGTQ